MTIQLSAKLNTPESINLYYNETFISTLTNPTTNYLFSVPKSATLNAWNSTGLFSDPLTTPATITIKNENPSPITIRNLNAIPPETPEKIVDLIEQIQATLEQATPEEYDPYIKKLNSIIPSDSGTLDNFFNNVVELLTDADTRQHFLEMTSTSENDLSNILTKLSELATELKIAPNEEKKITFEPGKKGYLVKA